MIIVQCEDSDFEGFLQSTSRDISHSLSPAIRQDLDTFLEGHGN